MKQIVKSTNSTIVRNQLQYRKGNTTQNAVIRDLLIEEQQGFCAYTEARISVTDSIDIEHFDEKLKYRPDDNYFNWYAVSHRWNNKFKKDHKVPVVLPHDDDLEQRIWYDESTGHYLCDQDDLAANNLIEIVGLNQCGLPQERMGHVQLIKDLLKESMLDDFHEWLLFPETKKQLIKFRRAMETALVINLSMIF